MGAGKMSEQSLHWYTRDGKAAHTQPNASKPGQSRNTTVRDARKLGLLPSVSGVCRMMSAPGLEDWKQRQLAEECYRCQPGIGETPTEYATSVISKCQERLSAASGFGSAIHASIEAALAGSAAFETEMATLPSTGEQMPVKAFVSPVLALLNAKGVTERLSERVVVSRLGYGGTVDLSGKMHGKRFVGDFKTKKTKPGEAIYRGLNYEMQIAAYFRALWPEEPFQTCANIFISSTEPGRVEWMELAPEQLEKAWTGFLACLTLWKLDNKFDPAF